MDVSWTALDPRARKLWRSIAAGVTALPAAALIVVAALQGGAAAGAAAGGTGVVAIGIATVLADRRWVAYGYAERDADLLVRRGVLVRRLTVVPYGRMQFVDVRQGPLERSLGLATVLLHTAAAATDAVIRGLAEPEAHRLRDRLAELGEARAAGV